MSDKQHLYSGEALHVGYRPTAAGLAAIAISGRGVAAVLLGDNLGELGRKLVDALPGAELVEDDAAIAPTLAAVARHSSPRSA